jgi:predicted ATPase
MITHLHFTNFKSWASIDLPLGRITGIFGRNSSGKTSILQYLLMLKQTKEATDPTSPVALNGSYVELGTLRDAIHNHDVTLAMESRIEFKLGHFLELRNSRPSSKKHEVIARSDEFRLDSVIRLNEHGLYSERISYTIDDVGFHLNPIPQKSAEFELTAVLPNSRRGQFSFTRTQGRKWTLPGPVKSYAFPDQARTYFQNSAFLSFLEAAYEEEVDKIHYLGPLRHYPQRDYLWAGARPNNVGQRGERAIDAILWDTEAREFRNLRRKSRRKPFQEIIAYWLREMGLLADFRMHEIASGSNRWQAKVRTPSSSKEVFLVDVGFGVSQVLPVITLLQFVPEGSTVILEQPEIHLHPAAQSKLADVIIQAAMHRNVQVILESHSEHLLLRIQRRIAEKRLASRDVRLYFCDVDASGSILVPIQLDLLGRILNWPSEFFGDVLEETILAERARLDLSSTT